MSTLVFITIFVLIALAVLGVAMTGGPGSALSKLGTDTRGSRRLAIGGFLVALLVLGAAVPAAVIALVKENNGVPGTPIDSLTASEQRGRLLFGERCASCHTLEAANARALVCPNLDELKPPKALVLDAVKNGRSNENGQMPAQVYVGQEATDVANFVARTAGGGR